VEREEFDDYVGVVERLLTGTGRQEEVEGGDDDYDNF
jgi:hypothetical protein